MIWLITGIPGSGKSYFAVSMVNDLINKEKEKHKISYDEASAKIKILHNIDGLKLGTVLEKHCVENDINPIELFTNNFHEKNKEFRGWTFILDECQTLFPKNLRSEDVQRFFQLHRHYGIDVVLLSQDYKLVCPAISLLSEFQYRAVSDTANPLPGFFMYSQMVGYEKIGRKFLRKKQKVFNLYKTADFDQKKVKRKARPMLILFIAIGLLVIYLFWGFYKIKNRGFNNSRAKKVEQTIQQKKSIAQKRLPFQSYNQMTYDSQYPESYLKKLNKNTLLTLDTIEDETGTYYLFMGTMWPSKDFPYKVVHTKLGVQAMVPLDVKQYEENKKSQLLISLNQNQNNYSPGKNETQR